MKVLIPILIGLLVVGCDRSDSMSQAEEDNQQKAGGNGENGPSVPGISIHEAAEKGDLESIKKHITAGTNINSTEWRDGETPLHRAITRGQTEAAKLLIEKGCNINLGRTKDGETPLDMAKGRGRTEIEKLLRDKGAKQRDQKRPSQLAQVEPQHLVDAFEQA